MKQHHDSHFEGKHLNDYKNIILTRWKTALAGFLVVFIGAAIYTFSIQPIYQAVTTLKVGSDTNTFKGSQSDQSFMYVNQIDAEIEVLRSRSIAEETARRLHLDWQVGKKSRDLTFKITEFSADTKETPFQVDLNGPAAYRVTDAAGNLLGTGSSGVPLKGKGIVLTLTDLHGKAGDSFVLTSLPLETVAARIVARTRASEVGSRTNIIKLSYDDPDPKLASSVVNTMAQVFVDMGVSLKSQESSKSVEFIEQQLKSMQDDLDKAEKKLQSYKVSAGVFSLDAESMKVFNKIVEADKQKTQLDLQRKQLEFSLASLREAIRGKKPYFPSDPVGAPAGGRLAELEAQKKALLTEYTEAHPQVRALQDQIDGIYRNLASQYDTNLKNLAKQEGTLSPLLTGYEGELRGLPEKERALASLMRQTKVTSEIYTFLLQKHEELRVTKAATVSNMTVIDPAVTPRSPIKPNKRKNITMGLLVGMMLGLGLAFMKEYLDDTLQDIEVAKRELELPLLAIIPYIPPLSGEPDKAIRNSSLIAYHDPKSSISEAFRSLRTSIHFSAVNRKRQVMMVTSTFPGEGKTTIIGNLAVTFSQVGSRVILIDCDMRRPSLHAMFGHSKAPGLSELLAGDADLTSLIRNTGIPGFDFISSGTTPPNPAELLGSEAMRDLVQTLRGSYDTIVLDAPPVLAVTDAPVLTTVSDMVLVVLESGRVPLKAARHMRELLQNVGAPVAGLIMNDKRERTVHRYGYYGDDYGYRGYYGDDRQPEAKGWWQRLFKF